METKQKQNALFCAQRRRGKGDFVQFPIAAAEKDEALRVGLARCVI